MNKSIIKSDEEIVNEFISKFSFAKEAILDACRYYVIETKKKPSIVEKFHEALPHFNPQRWLLIESIGLGTLLPDFLTAAPSVLRITQSLSLLEQGNILQKGIPLLINNGDHILVYIGKMSNHQKQQVFAFNHIRTLAEQKVWMIEQGKIKDKIKTTVDPIYRIEKGKLIVTGSGKVVFTRRLLLTILAEME